MTLSMLALCRCMTGVHNDINDTSADYLCMQIVAELEMMGNVVE